MLSKFDPKDILVVSARQYGQKPVKIFSDTIKCMAFPGRFVPGTLTNPSLKKDAIPYIEPKVLLVTDPAADQHSLTEAVILSIP